MYKLCSKETQNEPMFQFEPESRKKPTSQREVSQAERIPSYSGEHQPFVLLRPSTSWMRPTHIGEENLLYSVN